MYTEGTYIALNEYIADSNFILQRFTTKFLCFSNNTHPPVEVIQIQQHKFLAVEQEEYW